MKKRSIHVFRLAHLRYTCLLLLIVFLLGCKTTSTVQNNQNIKTGEIPIREYSVQSVLWQQQSAEYKALCYQAFNIARFRLEDRLSQEVAQDKPLAIITDIDETVLDNSPNQAKMIEQDVEYSRDGWAKWVRLEKAEPVPGALEFMEYARSMGVEVYYVSNRSVDHQQETLANLQKMGFPYADNDHILLKSTVSGKEGRRKTVATDREIILLMGDNLSDFSELFDNRSTAERNAAAQSLQPEFGNRFIVLPNPMYGDWETKGIYEGKYNWTPVQKDSLRRAKLIGF